MPFKLLHFFIFCLCGTLSSVVYAADRVALVIGNNAYPQSPLVQARNDAKKVGDTLQAIGFKVIRSYDANRNAMDNALSEFGKAAQQARIALIYYAGHAIQVEGNNFLIPANTSVRGRSDLRKLINLDEFVLEAKRAQGLGLVLLDACRNNPFADRMATELGRSLVGRGLGRIESTPTNVLVGFATKENDIAPDDSHYARALLKYLPQKGLEVRFLIANIRDEVMEATGDQQQPYVYGTLGRKKWFLAGEIAAEPSKTTVVTPPAIITPLPRQAFEPEMQFIKGGTFQMGCVSGKDCSNKEKVHLVSVNDFWLGKYEVTFAEWDACVRAKGCSHEPDDGGWGRDQRPVINISWDDANEYVRWLNNETGKTYRLPTEAEWEYAARAGSKTAYAWGNKINCDLANYGSLSKECTTDRTRPVASYKPYGGLYDMHGNVWEWTCSAYESFDYNNSGAESRCATTTNDWPIVRGGGWSNHRKEGRSAVRNSFVSFHRSRVIGVRLALSQLGFTGQPSKH